MLEDTVRVQIDLRAFADNIVRGDGRPSSETDAAVLLRELGWTYDEHGWSGDRRALAWLRQAGARTSEPE